MAAVQEKNKRAFRYRSLIVLAVLFSLALNLWIVSGVRIQAQNVDVDPELALRMTLPGLTVLRFETRIDFDLIHCLNWSGVGETPSSIGFYVGHAADYHPSESAAREKNTIFQQLVTWYEKDNSPTARETLVHIPEREDIQCHIFISCSNQALVTKVENALSTLEVSNPAAPAYQPKEKAQGFYARGDWKAEVVELDKRLINHPDDVDALFSRAFALAHLKRYKESIATYTKIIDLKPNSDSAWCERAQVEFDSGQFQQCLDDCKHAGSIAGNDPYASGLSYQANLKLKRYQDAIVDISEAIAGEPTPIDHLIDRAKLHRLLRQYDLAVDDCTRVLKIWVSEEALEERAKNYELLGKQQLAADDREELKYRIANTVRSAVGGPTRAEVEPTTGKSAASLSSAPDAQKTDKHSAPRRKPYDTPDKVPDGLSQLEYYHLARNYGGTRPKQALECIQRVERMDPARNLADKAHRLRDTMLPKQMPPDEAIALNRQAFYGISDAKQCRERALECIERFPDFEYGYITLGSLEKDQNNGSEAEKEFRRALRINPHNVEALSRLGDILRQRDEQQARAVLQQAVAYDPDDDFDAYILELLSSH